MLFCNENINNKYLLLTINTRDISLSSDVVLKYLFSNIYHFTHAHTRMSN